MVVFTSFAGIDSHHLLLEVAKSTNLSVYLGLPGAPRGPTSQHILPAYYSLLDRYLSDHQARYNISTQATGEANIQDTKLYFSPEDHAQLNQPKGTSLYDVITGYFCSDDVNLPDLITPGQQSDFFNQLSIIVHKYRKEFGVSSYAVLTRAWGNHSIDENVSGLTMLRIAEAEVVAVQEGRGQGRTAAYFSTEVDMPVKDKDPDLWAILQHAGVNISANATFGEVFTGSIHEVNINR